MVRIRSVPTYLEQSVIFYYNPLITIGPLLNYCHDQEWFGTEKETATSVRHFRGSLLYLKSAAHGAHHKRQDIVLIDPKGDIRQIDADLHAHAAKDQRRAL